MNTIKIFSKEATLTTPARKNQHRVSIITLAISTLLISCQLAIAAPATSAWSCGAWTTDSTNSCVEIQTCTRSICDTKGTVSNCRNETKTSKSTDPDCTPAASQSNARNLGKKAVSFEGNQKIKAPAPGPIPIPYPITTKSPSTTETVKEKRSKKKPQKPK